jgi:hypothetical protein
MIFYFEFYGKRRGSRAGPDEIAYTGPSIATAVERAKGLMSSAYFTLAGVSDRCIVRDADRTVVRQIRGDAVVVDANNRATDSAATQLEQLAALESILAETTGRSR